MKTESRKHKIQNQLSLGVQYGEQDRLKMYQVRSKTIKENDDTHLSDITQKERSIANQKLDIEQRSDSNVNKQNMHPNNQLQNISLLQKRDQLSLYNSQSMEKVHYAPPIKSKKRFADKNRNEKLKELIS